MAKCKNCQRDNSMQQLKIKKDKQTKEYKIKSLFKESKKIVNKVTKIK